MKKIEPKKIDLVFIIMIAIIIAVPTGYSYHCWIDYRDRIGFSGVVTSVENSSTGNIIVSFDNNKTYEIVPDYHIYREGIDFSLVGLYHYPNSDNPDLYYTDITLYAIPPIKIDIQYPTKEAD